MAEELPPGTPEVTDTILIAELLEFLSVRGRLGRLPLADLVVPVINLGDVRTANVDVLQPAFRSLDIFSAGPQTAPGAGTVLADTTAVPLGTYDCKVFGRSNSGAGFTETIRVQHRDAANAATLAEWDIGLINGPGDAIVNSGLENFAYELALNERLRIVNPVAGQAGREYSATIFARIRA